MLDYDSGVPLALLESHEVDLSHLHIVSISSLISTNVADAAQHPRVYCDAHDAMLKE